MEVGERTCCVLGYLEYMDIWEAAVGENLKFQRELYNSKDSYAVAAFTCAAQEYFVFLIFAVSTAKIHENKSALNVSAIR